MRAYELTRKLVAGQLSIRLWIDAESGPCEHCEERADEIALCVSALVDEDDLPTILAEKIFDIFTGINAVEITDGEGNGAVVRSELSRSCRPMPDYSPQ